jgi:hypothetical protein
MMRERRSRRLGRPGRWLAATAALGLGLTACSGDGGGSADPPVRRLPDLRLAAALAPFESCDALLSWIKAEAGARVGPYGFGGGPIGILEDFGRAEGDDSASADRAPATGPVGDGSSYSTTNVQVEGVDEPDTVKTDGQRLVTFGNGKLHLVDVGGDAPVLLDSLELPDVWSAQLLMDGDRLLVLASAQYGVPMPVDVGREIASDMIAPGTPGSTVIEVDLTGDELRVVDTVTIEGAYVSARMIGDVARIVVHSDPQQRLEFVYPASSTEAALARAEAVNRDVIDDSTLDDWLPHWSRGPGTDAAEQGRLVDCPQTHRPQQFSGFGVLSVLTVDLSEGLVAGLGAGGGTAVMAGGETVSSSATSLYVATQEWVDWEALSDAERRAIERDYATAIHRFDISDPTRARYDVSGRVEGRLLNQFAMDEHDGVLRVATTTGSPWAGADGAPSESHVVTLAPADGALREIGRVGGLGRTETIRAVRFLGDIGYVVTFRQTDPLYTVDLSDPAAPRVTGELKILGYSAYLHPVGDGLLLGIGQDADEDGRTSGMQVSLFDVRDLSTPRRVAQTTLPGASSEAEWDHHAFLWWAPTGLAMVPVNAYDEGNPVNGAVGFTVDLAAGTVTELGRVRHPLVSGADAGGGSGSGREVVPAEPEVIDPVEPGMPLPTWSPTITRALVVGDQVLTVSEAGVLASDLHTLAPGPFVVFP